MTRWWMIRAGDNNELIPEWQFKGVATIGWSDFGNPKTCTTRDNLVKVAHSVYANEKPGTRVNWAGQVWRFSNDIIVKDKVITYSKEIGNT